MGTMRWADIFGIDDFERMNDLCLTLKGVDIDNMVCIYVMYK